MESTANEKKTQKPLGFGKTMLASAVGVVIAFAVINIVTFIACICFLVSALAGFDSESGTIDGDNLAVKIDLTLPVSECAPGELTTLISQTDGTSVQQILAALDHAAGDERVNALYLHFGGTSGLSWAQAEELQEAVTLFKEECGKPVIAYGDALSQPEYYLATAADQIALHPSGMVDFRGMGAEVMFYKGLLDKLGVHMELIRPASCAYKSAGEIYTRTDMSDANREQVRAYISSIWNYAAENIAARRGLSVEQVNTVADSLTGVLPDLALKNRLVDTLCFAQDIKDLLKARYDVEKIVSANRYADDFDDRPGDTRIAVIYAEGSVVPGSGNGTETAVFGDDIVKALSQAADDDDVKAIVLRVNSPGGAVTASESMTHAVRAAKEKKPVIVSMSGLAASAGYEISCFATKIVAHPTTLTGSIGVFATIPEIGVLLRQKLGITTDTVMTNRNSTGLSVMRPLSPAAKAMLQRNVEDFYVTFVQRVADGRKMTWEQVNEIARGRVWTGLQAKGIGLVDTLGGLPLALRIAAEEAGIEYDGCSVVVFPKEKDLLTQLFELKNTNEEEELRMKLCQIVPFYSELEDWSAMEPLQARLPFAIRID